METASKIPLDNSDGENDMELKSILMLVKIDVNTGCVQASYKKLLKSNRRLKKSSKHRHRHCGGLDGEPTEHVSEYTIPNRFYVASRQKQTSRELDEEYEKQLDNFSLFEPPMLCLRHSTMYVRNKRNRSSKLDKYTPTVEFNIPHRCEPANVNNATHYQPHRTAVHSKHVRSFMPTYASDIYNPDASVGFRKASSRQYHGANESKYAPTRIAAQHVEYMDPSSIPQPYQHQQPYQQQHQQPQQHQQHQQHPYQSLQQQKYNLPRGKEYVYPTTEHNYGNYSNSNPTQRKKQIVYDSYNDNVDTTPYQYDYSDRQTSGCVSNNYVPRDSFDYHENSNGSYHSQGEYSNGKPLLRKMKSVEFRDIAKPAAQSNQLPNAYAKESFDPTNKASLAYMSENETPYRQYRYDGSGTAAKRGQLKMKWTESAEMLIRENDVFDIKQLIKQQDYNAEACSDNTPNCSKAQNIPNNSQFDNSGQQIAEDNPASSLDRKLSGMCISKNRSFVDSYAEPGGSLQQNASKISHKSEYSYNSSPYILCSPTSRGTFDDVCAKPRKRLKDRISGFFKKPAQPRSKSRIYGHADRSCSRKPFPHRPKVATGGYMHKIRKSVSCLVVHNGRVSSKNLRGGINCQKKAAPNRCAKPISYPTVYRDKNYVNEDKDELNRSLSNFPKVNSKESQGSKTSVYVSQPATEIENNDTENISNCSPADNNTKPNNELPQRSNINLVLSIHTNNCSMFEPPKIIDNSQLPINVAETKVRKSSLRNSGKKVQKKEENLLKPQPDDMPARPIDILKQELLYQFKNKERWEDALKHPVAMPEQTLNWVPQ